MNINDITESKNDGYFCEEEEKAYEEAYQKYSKTRKLYEELIKEEEDYERKEILRNLLDALDEENK